MSNNLFSEFNKVSTKEWKQKIQVDLKGADYNESLIWKTPEGIHVKPFYNVEDLEDIAQYTSDKTKSFNICQSIFVADVIKSNTKAINTIKRGAESILFIVPSNEVSINDLLQNINVDKTPVHFEFQFLDSEYIKRLSNISSKGEIHIQTDIIGNLVRTGNWYRNLKEDHIQFENIIKNTSSFSVDISLHQNAGATIIQQLAYALAHTNEYLNHLDSILSSEEKQSFLVTFKVAVGTNYFFEIAKLRALRLLYKTLASEYNFNLDCHLFVMPTKRNKTLYDYNTNLLRTTTECMSAILGEADTIYNLPYDAIYHKDNEFGERIARNQLLILKNESYFDKVKNPSDGAYYIESLTNQLAKKALVLFKDIETNGGFLHQLKEGVIQRKIKESAAREQKQFNEGNVVLLGTNKYQNTNDRMKNDLELYPFVKTNQRKTLIEPIIEKRLAENIEQQRLKTE